MGISIKDAEKLGLLSKAKAKQLRSEMTQQTKSINERIAKSASTHLKNGAASIVANPDNDPQKKIYEALQRVQPNIAMWEVEGLVPDRKFRCDIYLPESRVVIEMDGYGPHRSKEQFQADRDKRNILSSTGYVVLAFYYAQVKNDIDGVVAQVLKTHNFYKPFMEHFFCAHLNAVINEHSHLIPTFPSK